MLNRLQLTSSFRCAIVFRFYISNVSDRGIVEVRYRIDREFSDHDFSLEPVDEQAQVPCAGKLETASAYLAISTCSQCS